MHKLLTDLPPCPPQHPLHAARSLSLKSIAVPYIRPLPTEETNWKVAFEAPSEIVLAGSWATKTAVKGKDSTKYRVDVVVAMPSVRLSRLHQSIICSYFALDIIPGEGLPQWTRFSKACILLVGHRFCSCGRESHI